MGVLRDTRYPGQPQIQVSIGLSNECVTPSARTWINLTNWNQVFGPSSPRPAPDSQSAQWKCPSDNEAATY